MNEPQSRTLHIYRGYSHFDIYDEDKKTLLYRAWRRGFCTRRLVVCRGTATKPTDTEELVGTVWFNMSGWQLDVLGQSGLKVSLPLFSSNCKILGDGIDWVWEVCSSWLCKLRGPDGSRLATLSRPSYAWTKLARMMVMGSLSTAVLDLQVVTGMAMLHCIQQDRRGGGTSGLAMSM